MKWLFLSFGIALGGIVSVATHDYYEFVENVKAFESKGARFTAENGQELCLRIQALEADPKPCEYTKDAP